MFAAVRSSLTSWARLLGLALASIPALLLLVLLIHVGLWRLDAYRVTSTVRSVPGIQILESTDLAEEDFGGPEMLLDLQVGEHRLELFDVTVKSLSCGAPIWCWRWTVVIRLVSRNVATRLGSICASRARC